MTPRSAELHLADMRRAIREIEQFVKGKTAADFGRDLMLQAAVERKLEVISEASRRLSPEWKAIRPEVPWRKVADLGNVFRHEYHRVDPHIVEHHRHRVAEAQESRRCIAAGSAENVRVGSLRTLARRFAPTSPARGELT